jgi:hypothetical protein
MKMQVWKVISLVGIHSPTALRGRPENDPKFFYETPKMSLKLSDLCGKMITSANRKEHYVYST